MASLEFLRPRLRGPRFDDGAIPLEVLTDLACSAGDGTGRCQVAIHGSEPGGGSVLPRGFATRLTET